MRSVLTVVAGLSLLLPLSISARASDPSADIAVTLQSPPTTPLVGSTFQLVYTVKNLGPDPAADASFSDYISEELELQSVDPSASCGPDQPAAQAYPPPSASSGGGVTGPSSGGGSSGVTCALGTMQPGAEVTVTLTLRRVGARETYNSAWVSTSTSDTDYDNNYADLYIDADTSNPADVGVAFEGPANADVGADFSFKLVVSNNGPSAADGTSVIDPIPDGLDLISAEPLRVGDSCTTTNDGWYGGAPQLTCDFASIGSGGSAAIRVKVTRASAYEIWNSAWVRTANYDDNYDNDYTSFAFPADPSVTSDIAVRLNGPLDTPLVGDTFDLKVHVRNDGPRAAGDVWVSDYLPPGVQFQDVAPADACAYNDPGGYPMTAGPATAAPQPGGDSYYPVYAGGVYCSLGSIGSGEGKTVTITVTRTNAREIWNSAWASSSNFDPNNDNNYGELYLSPDKTHPADLAVSLGAPDNPPVGSAFDYQIQVTNNGPSAADGVIVGDYVPFETDYKGWAGSDSNDTCSFVDYPYAQPQAYDASSPGYYGSRELRCDLGTLDPGASATITLTVTRNSEYEIWNSAWVSGTNYDSNYENDYSSVLVQGKSYDYGCPPSGPYAGTGGSDQVVVGACPVSTKGGADTITAAPGSGAGGDIRSGAGSDTIALNLTAGDAEPRTIAVHAGRGADNISLSAPQGHLNTKVVLYGGSGDDSFSINVPPGAFGLHVVVHGRGGNDRVTWRRPASVTQFSRGRGMYVRGGSGSDLLQGGDLNDIMRGGRGRDRLYGGLGGDRLAGGPAPDVCFGGPGRDIRRSC